MFERFTDRARRVLVLAQDEANRLGQNAIATESLLLGLIREGEAIAAKVLADRGVTLGEARLAVAERIGVDPAAVQASSTPAQLPFTPAATKMLELSMREALQLGHNYIGTEHMLLGLLRYGEGVGCQVLITDHGLSLDSVRRAVIGMLTGSQEEPACCSVCKRPFKDGDRVVSLGDRHEGCRPPRQGVHHRYEVEADGESWGPTMVDADHVEVGESVVVLTLDGVVQMMVPVARLVKLRKVDG